MSTVLHTLGQLLIGTAYASSPYYGIYCSALGTYCGDGQAFIIHIAMRTAQVVVIPFVGGLAVIGVIVAAIKMQTAFGNEQGKEDAKKIIGMVVVGVVLAVIAVAIVNWICIMVQDTTGGGGLCA